jgi:hypothetical protein
MRHQLKILMCCLFLFPCSAFACFFSYCVGDSFYQPDIYVNNLSSQGIMLTYENGPAATAPKNGVYVKFPADLVTTSAGQTFSHTVDIRSAVDFKLICTIKTNAVIASGDYQISPSVSTDESKCHVHVLAGDSDDDIDEIVEVRD